MERLADSIPLKSPWAIAVDPSNLCNFHCKFCPNGDKNILKTRPNGIMPLSLFKKIVDDISDVGWELRALKLWKDGEPLLNPDLPEFIRYAKSKKIAKQIRLTTNGSLLHKVGENLIDAGLDWIMISFLSPNEEDYLMHSGKRKMRNLITKNVEMLRKLRDKKGLRKPFISVKICVFPFISERGIDQCKIQFSDLADEVVIFENPINWDGSTDKDFRLGALTRKPKLRRICPYAWYQMNINFNGEVSVCPVDWSFKTIIGDVNKQSIYEIWTGKRMKDFRDMFVKQELYRNAACNTCDYYFYHEDNIDDVVLFERQQGGS